MRKCQKNLRGGLPNGREKQRIRTSRKRKSQSVCKLFYPFYHHFHYFLLWLVLWNIVPFLFFFIFYFLNFFKTDICSFQRLKCKYCPVQSWFFYITIKIITLIMELKLIRFTLNTSLYITYFPYSKDSLISFIKSQYGINFFLSF